MKSIKQRSLLSVLAFVWGQVALAKAEAPQGIVAAGTCLKKIDQDRGAVTLTNSVLAPTAQESAKKANQENQKLRSAIQALKLEGAILESANYSVYEDREYQNKKWVSRGFRTNIGLRVETSQIARLSEVIAAANAQGLKNISGLSTFVSPEKMKEAYESCLESAARNARDKAENLAKGASVKLGKVLAVIEGNIAPTERPMAYKAMSFGAADASTAQESGPTIESRPEDLSVNVTIHYSIQ